MDMTNMKEALMVLGLSFAVGFFVGNIAGKKNKRTIADDHFRAVVMQTLEQIEINTRGGK